MDSQLGSNVVSSSSSSTVTKEENSFSFMESFEQANKRLNERAQQFMNRESSKVLDERSIEFHLLQKSRPDMSKEEREKLYCEIMYTIKHKIGRNIDGHNDLSQDLYRYAQQAFGISDDDHKRLFAHICEEKPPILVVNVEIIEAKNLEAKDANGVSDPYCMLGIIPGDREIVYDDEHHSALAAVAAASTATHVIHHSALSKTLTTPNFNKGQLKAANNLALDSGQFSQQQLLQQHQSIAQQHSSSSTKTSLIKRFSSFRKSEKAPPIIPEKTTGGGSNLSVHSSNNNIQSSSNNNTASSKPLRLGPIRGKLPAKVIKATDVKKGTLNPVWMEKFRFQLDDVASDILHLDIWDHDDEFSVVDAAKKLNEVKSLKGLDRYFKQIAQSARTNKADKEASVDDFLGSVDIKLDDIPSNGIDRWFELESKSDKSKVSGSIHLRIKLATREDRGVPTEEDNLNDLIQQENILSTFMDYRLCSISTPSDWDGSLGREAETILHQHAIQGDVTDFQIAISHWIIYSKKHMQKELSYKLLMSKLDQLERVWHTSVPSREEVDSLRDSFDIFTKYCFNLIGNLHETFVTSENHGIEKLENVLRLLNKMFNMNAFKHCFPFQNTLIHELINLLKSKASEWFDNTADTYLRRPEDDSIKKLTEFVEMIYIQLLIAFKFYKPIFENELGINYFSIVYKRIDSKLIDLVRQTLTDEFGEDIKRYANEVTQLYGSQSLSQSLTPSSQTSENKSPSTASPFFKYNTITEQIAIGLFELYAAMNCIFKLRVNLSENDRSTLKINNFHELFYMPYKRWIDLMKRKIDAKVEKCFESEKSDVLTELTKFGSSSVEICNCITQAASFWKLIEWPDYSGAKMYINEMVECLSRACIRYATQVKENNVNFISSLQQQQQQGSNSISSSNSSLQNAALNMTPVSNNNGSSRQSPNSKAAILDPYQKLIITANNLERVREALRSFLTEMDYYRYMESVAEKVTRGTDSPASTSNSSGNFSFANNNYLETLIQNSCDYMIQINDLTIETIISNKVNSELEPHMFYLFESPDSCSAQESLSRLIQYLDSNLALYKDLAFKSNFDRLLSQMWTFLLNKLDENLQKDDERSTLFFARMIECLRMLVDFFNAENQGIPKEILLSDEKYKELKKYLKLQTYETNKLILSYYQELLTIQNGLKTSECGVIYVRAFYHTKDELLVVEVFKCRNLLPMDANGLSDPYVEIELKPHFMFPNTLKQTSSVIKKTLNPIYNEIFEFKLPEKLCHQMGCVIHFTVMDHDLVFSNDFEGEALLDITTLPGVRGDLGEGGYKDLKYVELPLIRPKSHPSKIIEVLERRVNDKLACEFLKTRRDKLKS